jgi:branched-chain amino acid transport system substrate-binding protein
MKKLSMLSILMAAVSLTFSQASLAACGEIHLGSAISLTGKYATNGIHAKNGYEYAIQVIKDNGGVMVDGKCYNFKVTYYDDESKGDRGATLAERLISQDKVQYMLGPYSSGMTKAIAPVTEKYKIPMVEAGLQVPVRGAVNLGAVPGFGSNAGRRNGGKAGQESLVG